MRVESLSALTALPALSAVDGSGVVGSASVVGLSKGEAVPTKDSRVGL